MVHYILSLVCQIKCVLYDKGMRETNVKKK